MERVDKYQGKSRWNGDSEMNCRDLEERLNAYVDGELPDAHRRVFDRHMEKCEACQARARNVLDLGDVLEIPTVPPIPPGFSDRLMIEARRKSLPPRGGRAVSASVWTASLWRTEFRKPYQLVGAVAGLLCCVLGVYFGANVSASDGSSSVATPSPDLAGETRTQSLYADSFDLIPSASVGALSLALLQELRE